ncbi:MAG TPA: SRPBCC family protein [Gammaproteobacteria bacterium]|nr:SRPBCC family protein [Gammaproteobacteria bacterium]
MAPAATVRHAAASLLTVALLATTGVRAAEVHSLKVVNHGLRYQFSADISLAAPPASVYKVLTDYNHLTRINGAIRVSRLLSRPDPHTALVYVETRVCIALFCRTLKQTREVTELTSRDIVAQTLPQQSNVRFGTASWHLEPEGEGTRMYWQSTIEPAFWIPLVVGTALMRGALAEQGRASARGIEKLARDWAHLPPLTATNAHHDKANVKH